MKTSLCAHFERPPPKVRALIEAKSALRLMWGRVVLGSHRLVQGAATASARPDTQGNLALLAFVFLVS